MSLLDTVVSEFGVDQHTASKTLGVLFTSVRMAIDTAAFGAVSTAFPDSSSWMREAPVTGGRTGEMLALATPQTLRRSLTALGFADAQVDKLGSVVGQALKEATPSETYDRVVKRLPLLKV